MLRVFGSAFGLAILVSFITNGNQAAIIATFVFVVGAHLYLMAKGQMKLKCPYCHKRVKLRAPACHHCGRTVVAVPPGSSEGR
jgi:hypothetical protein